MTLNLAQLLCVLRREESWSGERIARRAQPAGSPAGIQAPAPLPRRARPAESGAKGGPAAPAPSAGCERGIKNGRREWGKAERDRAAGRGRERGKGGKLEIWWLERNKGSEVLDVQNGYSHDEPIIKRFFGQYCWSELLQLFSPSPHRH